MTRLELLTRIAEHSGLSAASDAEPIARAVLKTVSERLSRLEAQALADELPPPLDELLRSPPHGDDFDLSELYARVAAREQVRLSVAVEHVVVVARALAQSVRQDVIGRIRLELPPQLAALFEAPEAAEPAPKVHLDPSQRTLAEGRPGGSRPLYEARPDRAHSQSVARASEPHGDTKLSTAPGMTQERERHTLATGRPGSSRPLSTTHPRSK